MPVSAIYQHYTRGHMTKPNPKNDASTLLNEAKKTAQAQAMAAVNQEFERQQVLLEQVSVLLIETGAIKLPIEKIREALQTAVSISAKGYTGQKRGPKPKNPLMPTVNGGSNA